jgi:hypothetical protein
MTETEMTENKMIAKVAKTLCLLESAESLYHAESRKNIIKSGES